MTQSKNLEKKPRSVKQLDERLEAIEGEIKEKEEERLPPKTFSHLSLEKLNEILGLTIKSDNQNKIATFLCMLSAFTDNSQFNIAFSAPSSSGKSYIPLEISKLFPEKSLTILGHASPTSFYHDTADEEAEKPTVDLERKIIIFLDMPHYELLAKLRPILSHDKKEVVVKITDRGKRKMRTKTITIIGFPSVIFCSANLEMDEQESTRFLVLSPSTDQEKIRQSIAERIKKESDNSAYQEWVKSSPERAELIERIKYIKAASIKEVLVSKEIGKKIQDIFLSKSMLKPRYSRDASRLLSLVKAVALLNLWDKNTKEEGVIQADTSDLEEVLVMWKEMSESQELNLPPYVLEIYKTVILPLFTPGIITVLRREVAKKHYEVFGRPLSDEQIRKQILPMLETAGLIIQEPDEEDKRNVVIRLAQEPDLAIEM